MLFRSTVLELETNLDDVNPQTYEYVMEQLFACGALDVPGIGERTLHLMLRWAGEEGAAAADLTQRSWLVYMTDLTSGALAVDDFNRGYDAIGAFVATKTKRELLDGALERKLLLAPIHDVTDVRADPQLAARDYWRNIGGDPHPGPFARACQRLRSE